MAIPPQVIQAGGNILLNLIGKALEYIPGYCSEYFSTPEIAREFPKSAVDIMNELSGVPGMTPASSWDLKHASPIFVTKDGVVVHRYVNPARFEHVFVTDNQGKLVFGGYVGWIHNEGLRDKEQELARRFSK